MAKHGVLGPILKAARERADLTQSDLAKRVGLAPNHIARLESGEKGVPRFDTVARLAAELGLSLDELSWACGYSELTRVPPKDRTALAQSANQLAKIRNALRAVDKTLSTSAATLQRQAGVPAEPPLNPKRPGRKKKS